MKKVVAIGIQDFESLRMNHRFYVDKTDFIREWWNGGDPQRLSKPVYSFKAAEK